MMTSYVISQETSGDAATCMTGDGQSVMESAEYTARARVAQGLGVGYGEYVVEVGGVEIGRIDL